MTDLDPKTLTDRYVAVWNEPDPDHRRTAVRTLWADDAVHMLHPPQDVRRTAATLGFDRLLLQARGHDELHVRVTRAYEEFVAPGTYVFRSRGDADRLCDVVKFRWEMVSAADGTVAGTGLQVLMLAPDGRIAADYQFIEG